MHELCGSAMCSDGLFDYSYAYDLANVVRCMDRLGIPWHPIEKKGHDFTFLVTYVGFDWDIDAWAMSLPKWKCEKYATRVLAYLNVLQVSALHYSARDRVLEGFRTVASARALCQPTSCGSEYFYNQCPQVWNLIGTEHSLNRSERRVQNEAS